MVNASKKAKHELKKKEKKTEKRKQDRHHEIPWPPKRVNHPLTTPDAPLLKQVFTFHSLPAAAKHHYAGSERPNWKLHDQYMEPATPPKHLSSRA